MLAKIQGFVSWCLQKIHEVGASHGVSGKLDRDLKKEGVGARKQSSGVGDSYELVAHKKKIDVIE